MLPAWRDKWIANAMSTAPMTDDDKARAREAVVGMYAAAGLAPPRVVFVPSPFVGVFAAGFAAAIWHGRDATEAATRVATRVATRDATKGATWDATWAATWNATRNATESATWAATWAATGAATRDATIDATRDATWDATWAATWDATRAATGAATRDATIDATEAATYSGVCNMAALASEIGVGIFGLTCAKESRRIFSGGNQYSADCALLSFFKDVVGLPIDYSKYQHWQTLCEVSGPRWVHEKFCIISDRPELLKVDDRNLPHAEDGPFCRWRDGTAIYAWHGTYIPAAWMMGKKPTAKEALTWPNTEQRRAACEIVGWGNILRELDAKVIDADGDPQIGTLVEVVLPDAGPSKFLRVTCGTGREFALPVPPGMRTALEANAWTYGLEAKDFNIEVRT